MVAVHSGDGWSYTLTEEDILWLGRATNAEGGDRAANIWVWLQRLVRFKADSLATLVRGHSQAVSLRWLRNGEFCAPGGRYEDTTHCSEEKLTRRAANVVSSPSVWGAETTQAIALLREGRLPNPVPRAINFADRDLSESFVARNEGSFILRCDGNCYIVDATSARWPNGWVTLGPGSRSSFGSAFVKTAFWGALIGTAGLLAWRYTR